MEGAPVEGGSVEGALAPEGSLVCGARQGSGQGLVARELGDRSELDSRSMEDLTRESGWGRRDLPGPRRVAGLGQGVADQALGDALAWAFDAEGGLGVDEEDGVGRAAQLLEVVGDAEVEVGSLDLSSSDVLQFLAADAGKVMKELGLPVPADAYK